MRHICIAIFLFNANLASAANILLAENGKASLPMVISTKASTDLEAVAKDLTSILERVTGAKFDIVRGDANSSGILLGTLADFPDESLNKPLEVRNRFDGREAFAIRTDDKRLRLIGATDLGASHAAYRFLEHVGCRWLFPAKEWEVIPRIPRLEIDLNEDDRPTILSRRIWYGWGYFSDAKDPGAAHRDYKDWSRRNRMASSLPIHAGHAWQSIFSHKTLEEHPEYRALTQGKRQGEQLCVSNPAVREAAVTHAMKQFEKNPSLEMVSMEASDGGGHCECENCRKIGQGTNSDQVFDFANHVARAVAKAHPGRMVGVLAYHEHSEPPAFALEPNVYVQLTAGFTTGRYTFDELVNLWPTKCANLGFYEYFSVWAWDRDVLPGGRGADMEYIRRQITRYASKNAASMDAESGNNWGPHGRGYYLANRLMWNPRADVDALLADFYQKAFGPAAAPMRRYYERLDPASMRNPKPTAPLAESIYSRHLLALAFKDIDEAARLAADHPDAMARIDHLKQYLRYVHLNWLYKRQPDKAKQKELALAMIRQVYRSRYSYMMHWQAMAQSETPELAKKFDEPSWSAHDKSKSPRPWQDDAPITRDEIDAGFREGLAYFSPQTVEERTFRGEWVRCGIASEKPTPSRQAYQGDATYVLHSDGNQPLEFTLTAGTIAWYRNRADARWQLSDVDRTVVDQGRIPLDGEPKPLSIKPPAAGVHYLDVDDSKAGWKIEIPAGRTATILLHRENGYAHQGHMQRMYFYVPAGTKTLHYFWSGGPHQLHLPDGKPAAQIKSTGEFVSIDVPQGADGKVWSFTQLALGHLYFFNAPNAIAASPEALLVPADALRK